MDREGIALSKLIDELTRDSMPTRWWKRNHNATIVTLAIVDGKVVCINGHDVQEYERSKEELLNYYYDLCIKNGLFENNPEFPENG